MTMTNTEQIKLLRARLSYLNGQMSLAVAIGDLTRVESLCAEIAETESRIAQLEANP